MTTVDRMFRAFADKTRLRVLHLLRLIGCLDGCFEEVPVLRKDGKRLAGFEGGRCK